MKAKGVMLVLFVLVSALGFFLVAVNPGNAGDQPLVLAQMAAPRPLPEPRDTKGITPIPIPKPRDTKSITPIPLPEPSDTKSSLPVPIPKPGRGE